MGVVVGASTVSEPLAGPIGLDDVGNAVGSGAADWSESVSSLSSAAMGRILAAGSIGLAGFVGPGGRLPLLLPWSSLRQCVAVWPREYLDVQTKNLVEDWWTMLVAYDLCWWMTMLVVEDWKCFQGGWSLYHWGGIQWKMVVACLQLELDTKWLWSAVQGWTPFGEVDLHEWPGAPVWKDLVKVQTDVVT